MADRMTFRKIVGAFVKNGRIYLLELRIEGLDFRLRVVILPIDQPVTPSMWPSIHNHREH